MYTLHEAQVIAAYYKDKVMGMDLGKKGKGLKINKLDIDKSEDGGYNVYCYANASMSVIMHTRIQLVAEHLGLIAPDDVLRLSTPIHTQLMTPMSFENFTYEEVATYVISSLMHESPKIMNVETIPDYYLVAYFRQSDNREFEYYVKFYGNTAVWANKDGRWRSGQEEKITLQEIDNCINVHITYPDGSAATESYYK